jgi:hypothetical protein
VSIFDRANKQKAARASRKEAAGTTEARAAVAEPEAPPVNGAEPAEAAPAVTGGAPWANPNCKACRGRGLTQKGTSCPICDNTAKRGKRPTSFAYVVELTEEGLGIAGAREDKVAELEAAGMPLEWVEGEVVEAPESPPAEPAAPEVPAVEPVAKAPEPAAEKPTEGTAKSACEQAADAAQEESIPAKAPAKATAKSKAGRRTVGLTIMVGAIPIRGPSRPIITSSEVLARFGAELAADMGAESYWALDSFKRRERLAQKADYIAGELARHVLVHPGLLGNDDEGKLVQALMGLEQGIEAVIVRTS